MTKQKKLRHLEYYDLQSCFDKLYEKSKQGDIFTNLMELITNEENIRLAYRNIKRNKGSFTAGVDKLTIKDFEKLTAEQYVEIIQRKLKWYQPKAVRRKEIPPLEQNKVFQPVRNIIIKTVMQMKFPTADIEIEMPEPDLNIPLQIDEEVINETVDNSVENSPQNKLYIKWSDSYKDAHKLIFSKESTPDDYKKAEKLLLSESNNTLALYDLGKLYSVKKSGLKDDERSFEFYEKALQGLIQFESKAKRIKPYLQYQIGMMYFKGLGTSIDNTKAVEYFEKSAELGNQYAKRLLAL